MYNLWIDSLKIDFLQKDSFKIVFVAKKKKAIPYKEIGLK